MRDTLNTYRYTSYIKEASLQQLVSLDVQQHFVECLGRAVEDRGYDFAL